MKNVDRDLGGKFFGVEISGTGRHVGRCDAARSRSPRHHPLHRQESKSKKMERRGTKYQNITRCNQVPQANVTVLWPFRDGVTAGIRRILLRPQPKILNGPICRQRNCDSSSASLRRHFARSSSRLAAGRWARPTANQQRA